MPRRKNAVPAYSHHKPSGQAYVRVPDAAGGRKTVYLGAYNTEESRSEYARVVAELAVTPVQTISPHHAEGDHPITVNEVLLAFWRYALEHYRRADGTATN